MNTAVIVGHPDLARSKVNAALTSAAAQPAPLEATLR